MSLFRTSFRARYNRRFGRMSMVIPDTVQWWLNSWTIPGSLESIAKGLNGFEELRKYIKQGCEFCKDVSIILAERAELEQTYAKGLAKLAAKLTKSSSNTIGTLANGWKAVSVTMEQEAELHKNLSTALQEEISKPIKHLMDSQHKARKPIEVAVDKSLKTLTDRRAEEYKAKRGTYAVAKDREKGEETLSEARAGKGKFSEKEMSKLDKKCEQAAKMLRKADKDYCELCEKAEAARQEWDFSVCKGSAQLQTLEEERINKMSEYLNQYNSHISVLGPRLTQSCDRLHEAVISVDLQSDLRTIVQQKGSTQTTPEQILLDCYSEDMQFSMKGERRKNCLQNYLLYLRQAIERERKGREGVEKLVEVYKQRPNFADQDAQDDAKQRLSQVTFMMNFLEASHFKMASVLAKLEGQQKLTHKFSQYIETARDKQSIPISTLKLPMNLALEGSSGYDVTSVTVGALASQGGDTYEDFDDDEFDEIGETHVIGRCKVMYEYCPSQNDELPIQPGDLINIYEKQPDGWWQGELRGRVGIFPATYVQEV
ncbi:nostrin-like isoform X2 [Mizuhopecten yessoensis]|uniref:nostrin-like isoform X2 n=1 Tax=Mizuhopecten yessoensis TaxID=6573 RepID=UPI000B459F43|nr:nostrin-like isoform X2 [Mizuhopecten yessoensis]